MWMADGWRDYQLLDCQNGRRLEQWGSYVLSRPDPQVIWRGEETHPRWRNPDAVYLRNASGGGSWSEHSLPRRWEIGYGDLRFYVGPMNFKHTGLFPEQAANWRWITERIASRADEKSGKRGKEASAVNVLNLFGYTGAATLFCAGAGARVCHVDAARGMVQWARDNAHLSGLADAPVRWIVDDCRAFAERELRRGIRYDAVILDPPSFGRGPGGQVWRLEEDLYDFLLLVESLLSDAPLFVLLNAYTTGLSPSTLTALLQTVFTARRGGSAVSGELGLEAGLTGLILPCGASGRWTS